MNYISSEEIAVSHDFIRTHIHLTLDEPKNYSSFLEEFSSYFLRSVLTSEAYENIVRYFNGEKLGETDIRHKRHLKHLINSLRRVFSNDQHYKGLIGEHLFAFYYHKFVDDLLWAHGPKGRSSAEPGIDFITFTGNMKDRDAIKIIVWETKTTKNNISTRASQIYDFFSEDGSFEENIDIDISAIRERFKNEPDNALKEVVEDLYNIVVNREENLCIGASGVSPVVDSNNNTFKKFAECLLGDLTKEQRFVKFLFVELLSNILNDMRENIWNKLQVI